MSWEFALFLSWLTVAFSYIPDAGVPAPHLGFVSVKGSQSFLIG
jgi:hypothetical protein